MWTIKVMLTSGWRWLLSVLARSWGICLAAALLVIVTGMNAPAWTLPVTAPHNQTVPLPTPTSQFGQNVPSVPTATPRPVPSSGGGGFTAAPPAESMPVDLGSAPDAGSSQGGVPSVIFGGGGGGAPSRPLTAQVAVSTLNVRETPNVRAPLLGTLTSGETVTVLARNPENTWWFVCCIPGLDLPGWVSAPLLQPTFDMADAEELIPLYDEDVQVQPPPTPVATATLPLTDTLPIVLDMTLQPTFVWQGQTFRVEFVVTNPNPIALQAVELSNQLPTGLILIAAAGDNDVAITNRSLAEGEFILFQWASLQPEVTARATLTGTVVTTLRNGTVLDSLASVRADNGRHTTRSITVGLPPAHFPDFE